MFIQDALNNRNPIIFGDGTETRDPVYISDVTGILSRLIDHPLASEVYFVGTGSAVSLNEIIRMIGEVTGKAITPENKGKPVAYLNSSVYKSSFAKTILGRDFIDLKTGIYQTHLALLNKS